MSSATAPRAYQRPRGGRSLKSTVSQKPAENPLILTAGAVAKEVGDEVRFRILSLDPDDCRKLEIKRTAKYVEGKTFKGNINNEIHVALISGDPEIVIEENDLSGIIGGEEDEATGEVTEIPLSEIRNSSKYRIPIYIYHKTNSKGATEEIEAPMVFEMTCRQFMSILELENERNADLRFGFGLKPDDENNTGKPQYDIILRRNAKKGQDTYKFFGLQLDRGKTDPGYNVEDEEAIGDDGMKLVDEKWEELQAAMDTFQTVEQIKYLIGGTNKRSGLSSRPEMPGGEESEPEQQVEENTQRQTARPARAPAPQAEEAAPETGEPAPEDTERQTESSFGFTGRRRRNSA